MAFASGPVGFYREPRSESEVPTPNRGASGNLESSCRVGPEGGNVLRNIRSEKVLAKLT